MVRVKRSGPDSIAGGFAEGVAPVVAGGEEAGFGVAGYEFAVAPGAGALWLRPFAPEYWTL